MAKKTPPAPSRYDSPPAKSAALYARALKSGARYADAVKAMCLQCVGWSYDDARACDCRGCPLWQARKRVFRARPTPRAGASADAPAPAGD